MLDVISRSWDVTKEYHSFHHLRFDYLRCAGDHLVGADAAEERSDQRAVWVVRLLGRMA